MQNACTKVPPRKTFAVQQPTRRDALWHLFFGSSLIGLRALATGIPAGLLLNPARASANSTKATAPQYVLFASSSYGEPLNANVPGTYDDANINHSSDASMAATRMHLGGRAVTAARCWAQLPQGVLAQTCFFHHATRGQEHTDASEALRLGGAIKDGAALPDYLAAALAGPLHTLRTQPQQMHAALQAHGRAAHNAAATWTAAPTDLAASLGADGQGIGERDLLALRTQTLDGLSRWAKPRGKAFHDNLIDQHVRSPAQVQQAQHNLVASLRALAQQDGQPAHAPIAQIQAALLLFQVNVTPVAMIDLPFGRDNHCDEDFAQAEVPAHKQAMQVLAALPRLVEEAGLSDRVTLCAMPAFGRTLHRDETQQGRDHSAAHAVGLLVGSHVAGSVVGGVAAHSAERSFCAQPIDARSGQAQPTGDVAVSASQAAFAKTVAAAVGVPHAQVDADIAAGQIVHGALARTTAVA